MSLKTQFLCFLRQEALPDFPRPNMALFYVLLRHLKLLSIFCNIPLLPLNCKLLEEKDYILFIFMHRFQHEEEFDQMYCCTHGSVKGDIQTTKLRTFHLHMNELGPRAAHSFAQTSVISIGSYDLPCCVLTLASLPGIPTLKSVWLTNLQEHLFGKREIKTGIM